MGIAAQMKIRAGLLLCLAAFSLLGCAGTAPPTVDAPDRGWVAREILDTPPYAAFHAGYDTAKIAMSRRKMVFDEVERAMWDAIFDMTAPQRDELIKRGRRQMAAK